jgi:hypothetical protein
MAPQAVNLMITGHGLPPWAVRGRLQAYGSEVTLAASTQCGNTVTDDMIRRTATRSAVGPVTPGGSLSTI